MSECQAELDAHCETHQFPHVAGSAMGPIAIDPGIELGTCETPNCCATEMTATTHDDGSLTYTCTYCCGTVVDLDAERTVTAIR